MTSYFENSTVEFSYNYIENIHDGRGYTAGRIGFTSATGDLAELVQIYCRKHSPAEICAYLDALKSLANDHSDDTALLGAKFIRTWRRANKDSQMRRAQDWANDNWYYFPAMRAAEKIGVRTALGKAILYDTIIQQGEDGDDSLGFLIQETGKVNDERKWLAKFLDNRKADLLDPDDHDSQEAWASSVDRVNFLSRLVRQGNFDLNGPIEMDRRHPTKHSRIP